jgi:uncharacterized surface protein with fasciclin (FAS1) repeats
MKEDMMRLNTAKTFAAAACAIALLGVAGCGSDDDGDTNAAANGTDTTSDAPMTPSDSAPSSDDSSMDPMADLVGAGCGAYADAVPDGAGSVSGMAEDPVATAASNNPLLATLTAAVSGGLNPKVNLVDTLNGGEFTVFAPVDDAFKALPKATVTALSMPKNKALLEQILTYHVISGQIAPDAIDGKQMTVEGSTVDVTGSGDDLKVNGATVICGGVHTANATVYLIDTVLSPPDM